MLITPRQDGDLEKLEHLARGAHAARMLTRYRCVIDALRGHTAASIAERRGVSPRTAQRHCYAYRDGGIEALTPKPKSGRPPRLQPDRQACFLERVQAGPTDTDGVCTLRGADFQRILSQEFGAQLSLPGVYGLLHRLGLSCLRPRPQHTQSDPEAQARWLEAAPPLSGASRTPTQTGGSRSGSRTRRASASRAG